MRLSQYWRWIGIVVLAWTLAFATTAHAAGLVVQINNDKGHPVSDAVVTVLPQDATQKVPDRHAPSSTKIIDQKNEMFDPYIATFRPGDKVLFRNSDEMRHHVYTFSPLKPFEFVLVPGESSKPIELDQTGVIAVGCNIHDQMITYLYVSDAPLDRAVGRERPRRVEGHPGGPLGRAGLASKAEAGQARPRAVDDDRDCRRIEEHDVRVVAATRFAA